ALARAGDSGERDHAARATTMKQLTLICGLRGIDTGVLDPIRNPPVVHFCGHRIAAPDRSGRFEADEEPRVAAELREVFAGLRPGVVFGSLAAGADILAAEAALEAG
ncbi:MAG: hypothetical protein GWN85_32795, partial [Gemmatimonadetes bacterium]|nr:hypothetical protein [Gemmatimonadota bacterium]NIR40150.1 hypothetical protein [Actinomycetota bacterium]NIS34971.1 hypothetical protein [Actinomycetota bacterium]NIT97847.1 hypothetical protein [Actinomycetota bacterium]NIU69707.1 hypothetical protein [Actinomycetota bacterium]